MSDDSVSVLVKKLGHELGEIRLRALNSLISKVDLGLIDDDDISVRKDLFNKLLDWFALKPCVEKEKVLKLILHLVKVSWERDTIVLLEASVSLAKLYNIQKELDVSLQYYIDQIVSEITKEKDRQTTQCLSVTECAESNLNLSEPEREPICIHGTGFYPVTFSVNVASAESLLTLFPHLLLPWQPLVFTDCHVIRAVEESLTQTTDSGLLLHSCYFFTDVLLQDFPSEVFLQRPFIVKAFIELMEKSHTSSNDLLYTAVTKCLLKLSDDLLIRIKYYCDPCTANLKQESCVNKGSAVSTASYGSERTLDSGDYLQNNRAAKKITEGRVFNSEELSPEQERNRNDRSVIHSPDDADSVLEQLQQLSVPQFCTLVLQASLRFPPSSELSASVITLLCECVTSQFWNSCDPVAIQLRQDIHHLMQQAASSLQLLARSTVQHSRVIYLQLLSIACSLLVNLIPVDSADSIPGSLKEHLSASLLDFSVMMFYPNLHKDIRNYVSAFNDSSLQDEWSIQQQFSGIHKAFTAAVSIFKKPGLYKEENIIVMFHDAVKSLEFHKNLTFIELFMERCIKKLHRWSVTENCHSMVLDTLLGLLAHYDLEIQLATYSAIEKLVLEVVGVKYTHYASQPGLLKIIFHTKFLMEIIGYGLSHSNNKVKQFASNIVIHLLKSKLLVNDESWQQFLAAMLPNIALLQCFMGKDSAIGRCLSGMFDPRKSGSNMIPTEEVLKANIRSLFCIDEYVRQDSFSHLIYMLSEENQSFEKLPKLSSFNQNIMKNICIVENKVDLPKTKTVQGVYQVGSLCQALELLTNTDVDARVRRSALTQLNVMLEDYCLQTVFLEQGGLLPLLNTFYNSLIERNYMCYPDSVVPIVSILKTICLKHSHIRQELSHQESLYYAILRAMFLFGNDDPFRIDASILLCLLVYSEYILSAWPSESPDMNSGFSIPEIVALNMRLPFKSKTHWKESNNRQPALRGLLMQKEPYKKLLRLMWSCEWCGGVVNLLKSDEAMQELKEAPFHSDLKANLHDIEEVQMSSMAVCKQFMYDIQNATTHENAEVALHALTRYFNLLFLLPIKESKLLIGNLRELPWGETFSRFLSATPASPEDETLLSTVLQFFSLHTKLLLYSGVDGSSWCIWFSSFIQEEKQPLVSLLKLDVSGDQDNRRSMAQLRHLLLLLCKQCCLLGDNKEPNIWEVAIHTIVSSLHCSDTQQFYNLAFLNSMLDCLTQLTSVCGLSEFLSSLTSSFVTCLVELVKAFHCGKGGDGATSFMGLSISQRSIVCLNHILCELHQSPQKDFSWGEMLLSAMGEEDFVWLASLWTSRDLFLRAGAMQLLAGLSLNKEGCIFLLQRLRNFLVWEACLGFLLDHAEASIVREQSAVVLTNLSSHIRGKSPISVGTLKQDAVSGMLELLKQNNFYREVGTIVSRLFIGTKIVPGGYVPAPTELYRQQRTASSNNLLSHYLMVYSGTPLLEGGSSCSDGTEPHLLTTPSFIKSLCWFFLNVVTLKPEETLHEINHFGLIRILLRSINNVPMCGDHNSSKTLYKDVLEMYTAVCAFLSTCVALDQSCYDVAVHTHGCVSNLVNLLDPEIYDETGEFLFLRNNLWSEVFHILDALSTTYEGYKAVLRELIDSGQNTYIYALHKCLKRESPSELLGNALASLTSILSHEMGKSSKIVNNVENFNSLSFCALLDESTEGADLCLLLIHIYDTVSLQQNSIKLTLKEICQALGSLLAVSQEASRMALVHGLLDTLIARLREHHSHLSVEAVDTLLNTRTKKKVLPVLQDVELLLELITNFLFQSVNVKAEASEAGLADLIHKMWVWFSLQPECLLNALKLVCTFTTDCVAACRSLVFTSTVHGVGLRKSPGSVSLLSTVVNLVVQEMSMAPQSNNLVLLQFAFHILKNACHSHECRTTIIKSNLFRGFSYLQIQSRKYSSEVEFLQNIWLDFLIDFSSYPEGQVTLAKVQDLLDILILFAKCMKEPAQVKSLEILRNIAFNQLNRPRLLGHGEYIKLLSFKLHEGTLDEKYLVVLSVWALIANNQKAKLTMKSAGIYSKLQEIVNQLNLTLDVSQDEKNRDTFSYVLNILNADDKKNIVSEPG